MELNTLVDWIIANKRGKAFRGYNREAIEAEVTEAQARRTLFVDYDEHGIYGVATAEPRLHVRQLLTVRKGTFPKLVRIMRILFPGFKWQGVRGDKICIYNFERGYRLLNQQEMNNRFFFRKEVK